MRNRLLLLIVSLMVTSDFGLVTAQLHGSDEKAGNKSKVPAERKKINSSTKLRREGRPWGGERDKDFHVLPLVVPGGRLLVTARDTVYMINHKKKVLWKYYVGAPVVDKLILDSTIIRGIAMDGIQFAVDLYGKLHWAERMNGRANYSQIALCGRDKYLVVIDLSGYRGTSSYDRFPD